MKLSKLQVGCIFISSAALFSISQTQAATVTLNAVNSGFYANNGYNDGTLDNPAIWGDTYRDWFGFDLSSVNGQIVGATLKIASDSRNGSGQMISWWDINAPYSSLGVDNRTLGLSVFNDLGSGTLYGQGVHTAGTLNSFSLTSDALASLNATHSLWAIGGSAPSGSTVAFGYKHGINDGQTFQLVLDVQPTERQFSATVPETGSSIFLFGSAALGLAALRPKRRGTA